MAASLADETFRALIFDCDGTLVNTLPAHVAALQATLQSAGLSPSLEWARTRYGQSPASVLEAVERELGPIGMPHGEVLRNWGNAYLLHLDRLEEVHAVCEAARTWHGRLPMAVASNGHRATVLATLDAVRLRHLFDTVVSIEDVPRGKPAPDLFLEAARRLAVPPADCLVLEDSDEGMEAARAAGMPVLFAPDL